jgi:hypothetical protein
MEDTVCKCYARPFWGDGMENIVNPYAVMVPREFISQQVRSKAPEVQRNRTLFFRAGACSNKRRAEVVGKLRALNRSDVDVVIITSL